MTKQEFFNLLEKYKKGQCSALEIKLLHKFCDDTQLGNITKKWSLTEEEETRIRILQNILKRIATTKKDVAISKNKYKIGQIAAIAACVIVLGISSYLLSTNFYSKEPSSNAITLKLENGKTKVINEGESEQILTNNGLLVGYQKGNNITYKKSGLTSLVYNTLTVPYGKSFKLQLSDGTKAHLNSGSSITYPVQFLSGQKRRVTIKGEAFLEVASDSLHPFVLNANKLNVKVLGTKFNISAYDEDQTTDVVLVEGKVAIYTLNKDKKTDYKVFLLPGDKGSFNKKDKSIRTEKVTTSVYTSWRNGKLIFRDMTFNNMLKKLERHYNVTILNKNKKISLKKFNANFGTQTLSAVLEELHQFYGINYNILDNGKIIIQ